MSLVRNRYRVLRRVGSGGMGSVYAAADTLAGERTVALKCLWPGSAGHALIDTLRSEFRILAGLRHPRLCQVHDFGRLPPGVDLPEAGSGPGYFLSRELIDGDDLGEACRDLEPAAICRLFAEAAAGLAVLHRAGLRHGDFKPANAIVSDTGAVRLIDFGLTTTEGSRFIGGTPAYLAPEIAAGRGDRRSDLYALGVSLFEVIGGQLPSGTLTGGALARWHQRGRRPALEELVDVPPALSDLVDRLVDPDPNRRLPTAAEVGAALDDVADQLGAPLAPSPAERVIIEPLPRAAVAAAERVLLARCRGRGGVVIELAGAPGSGRSTALTELGWRAQLEGVDVVAGAASGEARPFAAIGPALEQIAALAGAPLPDAGGARSMARRFDEIARWLADVVRFPVAIVCDDFDAADAGSRALVAYLARALPDRAPLAIAVAREPGPPVAADAEVIELAPLSVDEIETLVRRAAGREDPDVSRRIAEHTGGNLLHVTATIEALARVDFAPSEDLEAIAPPARLVADAARYLTIAEPGRSAIAALAILGRADRATLAAVAGLDPDELDAAVAELPIDRVPGVRGDDLRFARAALGPAIAESLDDAERRALHRRAVTALAGDERDAAAVFGHRVEAGDVDGVARSATAALETIAATGDHAAALRLGARALALLEGDGRAVNDLRRQLGELARLGGDPERCRALLAPLADAGDAVAALSLARALDAAGETDEAEARLRQATGDDETRARAIRELCYHLLRRGEAEAALAEAGDAGDPHVDAARAYARGVLGRDPAAGDRLEAVAAEARLAGDRDLEAAALHLAGRLAYRLGDWRATRRAYERALDAASSAGDVVRVGTLRMNLAAMDQSIGEWRRARDFGNQAVSLLRAAGARTYALIARRNLGQLLCELGQYQQARRELSRAAVEADDLKMPVHRAGIDALLGIAAARTGELSLGRERLARAAERFAELGDDRRRAETLLDLAELELELAGDAAAGARLLDAAGDLEPAGDHPGRRCRLAAARALAAALRGERAEARRHLAELDRAEGELADQGGDPLRAELHRLATRAAELVGDVAGAERHRAQTLELLEAIAADLSPAERLSFWQDPRRRDLARRDRRSHASGRNSTVLRSDPLSVDRLFRLLDIYRQLSGEADPDRLLEQAMDRAIELFGASRGFLLLSSEGGDLRTAVSRNLPAAQLDSMRRRDSAPGAPADDLPYSRTVAEEVFRTGEAIIGDVRLDSRFANAASVHALEAPTVICVPACANGAVVGALYLESAAAGLAAGADDARLLAAFGDQIAVLLREAETKRVLAQRAEQLERARADIEGLLAERTRLLERRTEELELVKRDLSQISRRLFGEGAFGLIGSSPAMERIYETIERAARADVPVLISGESGTGKELVARALHQQSRRAERKLVAVNCGALPETLLESELFGHERGAFTGADRARRGLFETADGGTLFLDEIGETPPRMQAALLRALQDGIIRRVGGTATIEVDVRLIAATNRDLRELVDAGQFREDLLYRLEVVPIRVPPLRERREDIPLLVEHFLSKLRERTGRADLAVASEALRELMQSPWPGNVRQLEHALTSAAVMASSPTLGSGDFDSLGVTPRPAAPSVDRQADERDAIIAALERCNWNKSKAARAMGMPRRTFYRRLKKYDIH